MARNSLSALLRCGSSLTLGGLLLLLTGFAVAIAVMLGVLFVRPSGIFGSAEAARLREY